MSLKKSLKKIKNFNPSEETEDYEISAFFDEVGDHFPNINELKTKEKKKVIKVFFDFLERQSPEFEENFAFIHLLESIDNPTSKFYQETLFDFNKKNPTVTSILLLNRFINSLDKHEKKKGIKLLKKISKRVEISEFLREEALNYYEYQLNKK